MDNDTESQAGQGPSADLSEAGLMPDESGEPGPTVDFDDPERAGDADFYHPPSRRRYRPLVRTETRRYSRALRGVERWDDSAFSFYPPRQAEKFNAMYEYGLLGPWAPDPKGHRLPDRPKAPWPFEPQVETWEDEAVIPLPLGAELTRRQGRLGAIMEEPRGGFNGGRVSPMDGSEPGFSRDGRRRLPELGPEGMARTDFLNDGGWHIERPPPTGEPVGRPRIDVELTPESQDSLIEQVGVDRETWAHLFRQGPKTAADREARAWVERSVAELMGAGRGSGIEKALMQVYGCPRRTLHAIAKRGRG